MENEIQYNWDDLEVGRFDLNHSQKFFARKHRKHEKISDIDIGALTIMDQENAPTGTNLENNIEKKIVKSTLSNAEQLPSSSRDPQSSNGTKSKICNIVRQPLVSKNQLMTAISKANTVPSVVKYKDIYEKKRQDMLKRQLEEERKNRMFRSKPAPRFAIEPKPKKSTDCLKHCTLAITPLVLKHSKDMEEKRKRQIEEFRKRNEPPKFVSRDPAVLYEEPFKPLKTEHHVEMQPFNLHMEKRLEERKHFDKSTKQKMEEKKRQVFEEEYERKKQDERLVREIRKMTTFKARPNPNK